MQHARRAYCLRSPAVVAWRGSNDAIPCITVVARTLRTQPVERPTALGTMAPCEPRVSCRFTLATIGVPRHANSSHLMPVCRRTFGQSAARCRRYRGTGGAVLFGTPLIAAASPRCAASVDIRICTFRSFFERNCRPDQVYLMPSSND